MFSILEISKRARVLLAASLVLLAASAGGASAFYMQSATGHGPDPHDNAAEDSSLPRACFAGGFSFSSADSFEELVRGSDLVVVGRAGDIRTAVDTFSIPGIEGASYQDEFAVHDIEVIQTLMGDAKPSMTVQFATNAGHCLEKGKVYVLFLRRTLTFGREFVDTPSAQNPAPFGTAGKFGSQAVWLVEGSKVFPDRHETSVLGQRHSGASIDAFLSEIGAAVDKARIQ